MRDLVGAGTAVVVIGSRTDRATTVREFDAYAPLVPVGSYVIVTDTIVNGHPVWPAFGAGPAEAVKQILTTHGEFVAESVMEKYSLTFNPGGFLRRVRYRVGDPEVSPDDRNLPGGIRVGGETPRLDRVPFPRHLGCHRGPVQEQLIEDQ